ncbi:MAG TPA: hypothetical protein PKA05_21300 [Roseiflexaceae bacterium]|nr:hypothetical protein [Roseiflexaceae bacterium]
MTTANPPTLDQALALARRLSVRDQARLIAQIAEALAAAPPTTAMPTDFALPVLTGGAWVDDLPLSRKELYGDDERC